MDVYHGESFDSLGPIGLGAFGTTHSKTASHTFENRTENLSDPARSDYASSDGIDGSFAHTPCPDGAVYSALNSDDVAPSALNSIDQICIRTSPLGHHGVADGAADGGGHPTLCGDNPQLDGDPKRRKTESQNTDEMLFEDPLDYGSSVIYPQAGSSDDEPDPLAGSSSYHPNAPEREVITHSVLQECSRRQVRFHMKRKGCCEMQGSL